jgi:hypothetical protein
MKAGIWKWSALALELGLLMMAAIGPAGAASDAKRGTPTLTAAEANALRAS